MILSRNLPLLSLPDLDVGLNERVPLRTGKHKVSGVDTSFSVFCSHHYWHRFRLGESGYSPLGCPGIFLLSGDIWLALRLCFSLQGPNVGQGQC